MKNRFGNLQDVELAALPKPLAAIVSEVDEQMCKSDNDLHDYHSDQPSYEHHRNVAPIGQN